MGEPDVFLVHAVEFYYSGCVGQEGEEEEGRARAERGIRCYRLRFLVRMHALIWEMDGCS